MSIVKKALASAGLALACIPAAHAAPVIVIDGTGVSGTFGNPSVTCTGTGPCEFFDTLTFTTPGTFNLVGATISTIASSALSNIDFSTVTLNGTSFTRAPTGTIEMGSLFLALTPGATNTLIIRGTTGGDASYAGALSFAQGPAVPEPASWALMILGLGAVGYAMRRRPRMHLRQAV